MDLLNVLIMHYPATKKKNLLPKKKRRREKRRKKRDTICLLTLIYDTNEQKKTRSISVIYRLFQFSMLYKMM